MKYSLFLDHKPQRTPTTQSICWGHHMPEAPWHRRTCLPAGGRRRPRVEAVWAAACLCDVLSTVLWLALALKPSCSRGGWSWDCCGCCWSVWTDCCESAQSSTYGSAPTCRRNTMLLTSSPAYAKVAIVAALLDILHKRTPNYCRP